MPEGQKLPVWVRDGEFLFAALAFSAKQAAQAPALIRRKEAIVAIDGCAGSLGSAKLAEPGFRLGVGHPHDLYEAQGARAGGQ